jgi:hypothetical protein
MLLITVMICLSWERKSNVVEYRKLIHKLRLQIKIQCLSTLFMVTRITAADKQQWPTVG